MSWCATKLKDHVVDNAYIYRIAISTNLTVRKLEVLGLTLNVNFTQKK